MSAGAARHPRVSVIMPFFNTPPRFVKEAIESVLGQSYPHWELILVDDGSAAESSAQARALAQAQPDRIHYREHPDHRNYGMSASRNLGLRHATSPYVAFLDSDDVWLPDTLAQQVELLEAHPSAAMVYGSTTYWHSWTGQPEDQRRDFVPRLGVPANALIEPPALVPLLLEGGAAVPCTCSFLARRQAVEAVGGFEPAFRTLYEDQVFYVKLCLRARVYVSGQCWGRYRQHPASSTYTESRAGQADHARLTFLNWLEGYLRQARVSDPAIWQALRRQVWLTGSTAWPTQSSGARRIVRWLKKWALRGERRLLPSSVRSWLWRQGGQDG